MHACLPTSVWPPRNPQVGLHTKHDVCLVYNVNIRVPTAHKHSQGATRRRLPPRPLIAVDPTDLDLTDPSHMAYVRRPLYIV